jgi:hypothetical protein
MARIQRRRFLQLSGAGALAASSGGLAGILASGRAPAYAQGTTVHWLKFVDFVPASDALLKGKIKEDCQKALGINLEVETINGDGVQARITSAIQAKTGPDILMAVNNWAQLYADSLADVSDLAEDRGKAEGGYFETARDVANNGKRWIAMPYTILGVLLACRTSWFAEEGVNKDNFPKTWEDYRALGKKMRMLSATRWRDGTPISGRGAARRLRPTARPSRSTARRQSNRSSSPSACGRTRSTKARCHGTMQATTAPICPTRSAQPATAPRFTCSPAASPILTRLKPASPWPATRSTRRCRPVRRGSSAITCRSRT